MTTGCGLSVAEMNVFFHSGQRSFHTVTAVPCLSSRSLAEAAPGAAALDQSLLSAGADSVN